MTYIPQAPSVTALPLAGTPTSADQVIVRQNGVDRRTTLGTLRTFLLSGTTVTPTPAPTPVPTPSPAPTPTPVGGFSGTLFGANLDGYAGTVQPYEAWLGMQCPLSSTFTGNANASDYVNSVDYEINVRGADIGRQCVSIPNMWNGGTLHDAAIGNYDTQWDQAIAKFFGAISPQNPMYVRIDWEHTAYNQFCWSTETPSGDFSADFITAWRRFVTKFRAADIRNQCKSVFCPNIGAADPERSWPGDSYVDVVGIDFYIGPQFGEPLDPCFEWDYQRRRSYGLDFIVDFALRHNKPLSIPEWGISEDNYGQYIKRVVDWCAEHNVLYACYWESNSAYQSMLSGGLLPNTGAAYRHYINPAKYPTAPAVPITNFMAQAQDLSSSFWSTYKDGGTITPRANGVAFTSTSAITSQNIFHQFPGQYTTQSGAHPQGTPAERFVLAATVTRNSGTGPFSIFTYSNPSQFNTYPGPYIVKPYTLAQTPVGTPVRMSLPVEFTFHLNENGAPQLGFSNQSGQPGDFTITNVGLYVDMVQDPYPLNGVVEPPPPPRTPFTPSTPAATFGSANAFWFNQGAAVLTGGGSSPITITAPGKSDLDMHVIGVPVSAGVGSIIVRLRTNLPAGSGYSAGAALLKSGAAAVSTLLQSDAQNFQGNKFADPKTYISILNTEGGTQSFGAPGADYVVKFVNDGLYWTVLGASVANASAGSWTRVCKTSTGTTGPIDHVGIVTNFVSSGATAAASVTLVNVSRTSSTVLQAAASPGSVPA